MLETIGEGFPEFCIHLVELKIIENSDTDVMKLHRLLNFISPDGTELTGPFELDSMVHVGDKMSYRFVR